MSSPSLPPSELLCNLLDDERICLVDVGAAGGLAKRWWAIARALHVVAFEPDARSNAAYDAPPQAKVTVVNRAAGADERDAQLYLTRKPRCSSLYVPNRDVVKRYPNPERFDVLGTSVIACTTVDDALARVDVQMDFIKIDTQGTELDVLRGAKRSLATCLGIEVEVEFQQLYAGSAVFRDIDAYISECGFEIFDLRRTFLTRDSATIPISQRKGQLVFGDALYFPNWESVASRKQIIKLAALMLIYGFADVVLEIVRGCPLLSDSDRTALALICAGLRPAPDIDAARKDRFVGAGLQLG